jgi:hypothetical protein
MCDTQNADNTQEWKLMFSQITDDGTKTCRSHDLIPKEYDDESDLICSTGL